MGKIKDLFKEFDSEDWFRIAKDFVVLGLVGNVIGWGIWGIGAKRTRNSAKVDSKFIARNEELSSKIASQTQKENFVLESVGLEDSDGNGTYLACYGSYSEKDYEIIKLGKANFKIDDQLAQEIFNAVNEIDLKVESVLESATVLATRQAGNTNKTERSYKSKNRAIEKIDELYDLLNEATDREFCGIDEIGDKDLAQNEISKHVGEQQVRYISKVCTDKESNTSYFCVYSSSKDNLGEIQISKVTVDGADLTNAEVYAKFIVGDVKEFEPVANVPLNGSKPATNVVDIHAER